MVEFNLVHSSRSKEMMTTTTTTTTDAKTRRIRRAMGYVAAAVALVVVYASYGSSSYAEDDGVADSDEEDFAKTTTVGGDARLTDVDGTTAVGERGGGRRGGKSGGLGLRGRDGGDSAEVLRGRIGERGSGPRSGSASSRESVGREDETWSDGESSRASGDFFGDDGGDDSRDASMPDFFARTKFFSVLELDLSKELFEASAEARLAPDEVLFRQGDSSEKGIYIVVEGSVGVYLHPRNGAPPVLTNILQGGESVGDIDVLDSARRSVSCIAMRDGAKVVQVSQAVFLEFVRRHPHTLQQYLQQAIARLWRVAQFTLIDFLGMPRHALLGQPEADDACSLDADFLEQIPLLSKHCTRRTFAKGEQIFTEGDSTSVFYILLKGSIVRQAVPWPKGDGLRGQPVRAPQLLGSTHFITRTPFRETQSVEENCEMLEISSETLEALREADTEAYVALLRQASSSLGVLIRNFIGFGLNRVWLKSGEHVFLVDEDATSMFVVISGRVHLKQSSKHDKSDVITRERGRGDTLGEAPLLAHGKYSSTAITSRDSELVRMSHGALKLINAHHSEVSSRLLELVACKLQNNLRDGDRAQAELVTIYLIPADPATKMNEFSNALQDALSMFGSTVLLSSSAIDEIFADGTTQRLDNYFYRSKLTSWMAQQEEEHRFIILQADPRSSSWSKVCASQADCVLVVAHANRENKTPLVHEQRLIWRARHSVRAELVLIHEAGSTPSGTQAWLKNRQTLSRHHHVRISSKDDMDRLARYISGHSVGVILTGGGGGGLAHLGALRALEENGIPIDCIGGTSQGTLTAGMYARTLSTSHILPMLRNNMHMLNSPHHLLTDLTLPLLSLFSGKGLDNVIMNSVGSDSQIEDLWLNFFCCSTNLTKNSLTVHTSGRLWRCVRASMTVLGLLPPVRDENDELLVDGGYLNSVPVDVMRKEMGVETVIVVDVEDKDFITFRDLTPYDGGMSTFGLLWDRLNPFTRNKSEDERMKHPSYADVLNALTATTKKKQLELVARDHRINLHLRPPGVSLWMANSLTLPQMDAAVRKAQAYTNVAVNMWKKKMLEPEDTETAANRPHSERSAMASHAAQATDLDSPAVSPSSLSPHVSPRTSMDSVREMKHIPIPLPHLSLDVGGKHKRIYRRKVGSRAVHLPSEGDGPSTPQHSSQLVRTFTDQAQIGNESTDPAVFRSATHPA